ncbi:MAG TPA: glycosyltransferase family 1 protein [Steroidobacteraceae bacterium]|nr:glycosyltransferase family 1 protein [Steroidobacteraceae bacterium]
MTPPPDPHSARRTIGVMGRLLDQADGLGIYARHLLQHLVSLDTASRYVIFLATPAARDLFAGRSNVEVRVLASRSRLLWDQVLVPRAARRLGVELLFNPKFSLPLFSRIPGVFILQSCDWYVNPGNYPWWDNIYIRAMLPLYCRKAQAMLAISQAALDDLARHGLKLPRALVTHAGVGPNFTASADPEDLRRFRSDYALPERFILTVARVLHTGHGSLPEYPGGNNERLLRAYRQYRHRAARPLPLVVAGRRVKEYLLARGFGAADLEGVRFLGFVPNERLHAAYQLADCFVLATLCESFGLPILEALATGCPAIVPNTCAGPEVAGDAALLIDPHREEDLTAAMLEITSSEPLRREMTAAGIERARRFGWPQAARRVLEAFDAVLSASASPAHTATAGR